MNVSMSIRVKSRITQLCRKLDKGVEWNQFFPSYEERADERALGLDDLGHLDQAESGIARHERE